MHPACLADIDRVLTFFGAAAVYGLRRIELRQQPAAAGPAVAALRVPGLVLLFEQPAPPWDLSGQLTDEAAARLRRAGARVAHRHRAASRVDWPGSTLRDFMLFDGLMHEIGHHMIQHAARRQRTRAMRTADHERRADVYAVRARHAWTAQW